MITFQATSFILGTGFGLFIGLLILKWVNRGADAEETEKISDSAEATELEETNPVIPAFLRGKK